MEENGTWARQAFIYNFNKVIPLIPPDTSFGEFFSYINNNPLLQIDTDSYIWIFQSKQNVWISLDGRIRNKSPNQMIKAQYKEVIAQNEWEAGAGERHRAMIEERESWAYVRLKAFERDNYQCQCCGKDLTPKTFHAHHLIPRRCSGSTNDIDNLITVCSKCHLQVEHVDYKAYERDNALTQLLDAAKANRSLNFD